MASADMSISPPMDSEGAMSAGEFVLKKLFAEFVSISEKKLKDLASQPPVSVWLAGGLHGAGCDIQDLRVTVVVSQPHSKPTVVSQLSS